MRIRDAMRQVLDGNTRGVVIFKDRVSQSNPKYTDFKYSQTRMAKKVMADREKLIAQELKDFIIVKVIGIYDDDFDYCVSFDGSPVGFEENLQVGDVVYLTITSNNCAKWITNDNKKHPFNNFNNEERLKEQREEQLPKNQIERKKALSASKFKDENESKKKRAVFKKLLEGLSVQEVDGLIEKWRLERKLEKDRIEMDVFNDMVARGEIASNPAEDIPINLNGIKKLIP